MCHVLVAPHRHTGFLSMATADCPVSPADDLNAVFQVQRMKPYGIQTAITGKSEDNVVRLRNRISEVVCTSAASAPSSWPPGSDLSG